MSDDALLVFRHAAPTTQGICYGQLDVPVQVSPAEAATQIERQVASPTPTRIWTSPSERCRTPATILAERWGALLIVDPHLLELSFGAWEGLPWSDLAKEPEFEQWARDWKHQAPPQGEALPQLEARVRSWWSMAKPQGPGLLVGHAGIIRALRVQLKGMTWDEAMAEPVPYLKPGL